MKVMIVAAFAVLASAAVQPQKKTESFWNKLLRIAGVSATPAGLRGEDESPSGGDIWLVAAEANATPERLTRAREYTSPVFDSQGESILALNSGNLWRISLHAEAATKLYGRTGVTKLVGISRDNPDQMLVLGHDAQSRAFAALVSIQRGTLTRIPHNPLSEEDRIMLAHLAGWERVYGDTRVYTEKNEKETAGGGTIDFTDIYLKRAVDAPINLTRGNGISSSEPSLSLDGRRVVFIRRAR